MARRVLIFESSKKGVKGIHPTYEGKSAHYIDLSQDYVLTVKKFRRRKRHLADLLNFSRYYILRDNSERIVLIEVGTSLYANLKKGTPTCKRRILESDLP